MGAAYPRITVEEFQKDSVLAGTNGNTSITTYYHCPHLPGHSPYEVTIHPRIDMPDENGYGDAVWDWIVRHGMAYDALASGNDSPNVGDAWYKAAQRAVDVINGRIQHHVDEAREKQYTNATVKSALKSMGFVDV